VQTNFKKFMKDCHASLILPENALIIARKVMPKMSEMGCKTEVSGLARHVSFTLRSRHRQPAPACPFGANDRD
jgi:hypothetical protein